MKRFVGLRFVRSFCAAIVVRCMQLTPLPMHLHMPSLRKEIVSICQLQVFIERPAAAQRRKYLNTIKVRHIANGICTHGLGVVTTAVNFVYQFLAKKLVALSQALYDDAIKSRMVKVGKSFLRHYFNLSAFIHWRTPVMTRTVRKTRNCVTAFHSNRGFPVQCALSLTKNAVIDWTSLRQLLTSGNSAWRRDWSPSTDQVQNGENEIEYPAFSL
jgi:hypothetical protein